MAITMSAMTPEMTCSKWSPVMLKNVAPKMTAAAGGIRRESPAFAKHVEPFFEVQHGKCGAENDGQCKPL